MIRTGRFFVTLMAGVLFFAPYSYGAEIGIGTGMNTWTYPLSTNYHDTRTQMIYLASELGGAKVFNSISLNIATKPGQMMNSFTIRFKHTDLSAYGSSPIWESTGWTIVFQANQTISTTGWVRFGLTTPFAYNGTQNLMVDISFNNSSSSSAGYCYYTWPGVSRSIYYSTNSSYGDPLTWSNRTPLPTANYCFTNIRLGYSYFYGGGSGTAADPYQIWTAEQMNTIGINSADWDKYFKLMADIEMSSYTGTQYNIIGREYSNSFSGIFDGNGHFIANLTYATTGAVDYVGLFGYTNNATIKNLGIANINFSSGGNCVGCLIGSQVSGIVMNCYSTGSATTSKSASYVSSTAGGLVGAMDSGTIMNSYSTVSVAVFTSISTAYQTPGGLVGSLSFGVIKNCYSTGSITVSGPGIPKTGGLVGYSREITIINSFWDIQTSGLDVSQGGKGRLTSQMKQAANYIGWNDQDNIWYLDEGNNYPFLFWENKPGILLPRYELSDFISGGGTANDPYLILDPNQLNVVGLFPGERGKVFKLGNDIDLSGIKGTDFNRIGMTADSCFYGLFDGQGYVIRNLTYQTTGCEYGVGLFGYTGGATIQNLRLENVNITSAGCEIGGLVGSGSSVIKNCYCEGTVTGILDHNVNLGMLAGYLASGSINNCYSTGAIYTIGMDSDCVGGLVGKLRESSVNNCYSTVSVMGIGGYSGGLVGENYMGTIRNSYSTGEVRGFVFVGGLVGGCYGSSILVTGSYSTGPVVGVDSVGGLIGMNAEGGNVSSSFWNTETSGQANSQGGTGKSTEEMKTRLTFTSAGWDFTNEMANGTNNYWRMCADGVDYPRLNWESVDGDFACPDGVAIEDLDYFVGQWLLSNCTVDNNYCGGGDEDGSGAVDLGDYAVFAGHWMEGV